MNKRTMLVALAVASVVPMANAAVLFADNFSTFSSGNLVGQGGWTQVGDVATNPIQVTGGQVVVPGGQITNHQDAVRTVSTSLTAGTSLFLAARLTVTSVPAADSNSGNGSAYVLAIRSNGFDNGRIVARRSATNPGKFVFGLRATGQGANPFVFGTQELNLNEEYTIIQALDIVSGATNDVFSLFVNPTSGVRGNNSVYATATNLGTDPAAPFNGVVISQFGSNTVTSPGVSIASIALTDDFGQARAVVPEPGTMAALGLGALALLRRRRK